MDVYMVGCRQLRWLPAISCLAATFVSEPAASQVHRELSSADRLAILYAPQLTFTRKGDPIIRIGIVEERDEIAFTPSGPIRVMPTGRGGAEIVLPGRHRYTVSIEGGIPGQYRHWVVVDSLPVSDRDRIDTLRTSWLRRGYQTDTVEVGGLFAIRGQTFDSRTLLVGVAMGSDLKAAQRLRRKLESSHGSQVRIHSELTQKPSGRLILKGANQRTEIRNRDVLWVEGEDSRSKVTFTVDRVPKSYGRGEETRRYQGTLIFSPDRQGKLVASISLGAEKLLQGVVPAEMYSTAPAPALQAQAVAARNEIFSAIGVRNLADPYMLRGDVMDQVYGGIGVETSSTTAAVKATRGQVMFFDGKIIQAFYSSNAGGFTENNENVWDMEPRPYLRGRPDANPEIVPAAFRDGLTTDELDSFLRSDFVTHSKDAPVSSHKYYRWTKKVDADVPQAWLRKKGVAIGKIRDIRINKRGVSGRVVRLTIEGTEGSHIVERELNARRLFGGLRSGLFLMDIVRKPNRDITHFTFRGAGFGHGVGMCQTGAIGMASSGRDYKQILAHYYRKVEVKRLY
jgi:stage II sporulation protein D